MKFIRGLLACLLLLANFAPLKVFSLSSSPEIVISQFKVTTKDGQFFMLFNNTLADIDMGTVQLVYYNNYNYASATSSKIIGLTGVLPAGGYYLVNDGPYTICHQIMVNSVSLSLSTTAGSVQVSKLEQASAGLPITSTIQDSVSWSKSSVSGVTTLPSNTENFLLRNPKDVNNNPSVTSAGEGSWQVVSTDPSNICNYQSTVVTDPTPTLPTGLNLLAPTQPPVTILSLFTDTAQVSNPNNGLMKPLINEILPNPASPLTDAKDEFIEIYNPNNKNFDLTGYSIAVGTTTKKSWKFPSGMYLGPNTYSVFTSSDFSVSLSNSGGQVSLLGPNAEVISQTKLYGTAKDNYAWALGEGEWYWTTTPTPGKPNIISALSAAGSGAQVKAGTGESLGSFTTASGTGATGSFATTNPEVTKLHPSSLASVAALAVGYGAYEYKQDLANKYRQFSRNRKLGRKSG